MPKGPQGQKRPADAIALAVMVGRIATGEEIEEQAPIGPRGAVGGQARAETLSPARRSEIAKLAAQRRWQGQEGMDMQPAKSETVVRGRKAVCMYPNNGLGKQKKSLDDAFSGFEMLRDRFKN